MDCRKSWSKVCRVEAGGSSSVPLHDFNKTIPPFLPRRVTVGQLDGICPGPSKRGVSFVWSLMLLVARVPLRAPDPAFVPVHPFRVGPFHVDYVTSSFERTSHKRILRVPSGG